MPTVTRLIRDERENRAVTITATRVGEWVQVKITARSVDRIMKLTDNETRALIGVLQVTVAEPHDDT